MSFSPDMLFASIVRLTDAYRSGATDPLEATAAHLARAKALQEPLHAFQLIDRSGAMQAAAAAAKRWQDQQPLGPLDGVPVSIKDNLDVARLPTRDGSLTTSPEPAEEDAPLVARLREAGAIILGKTTVPEFCWRCLTGTRLAGVPTRNPWDRGRTPGGSSGGACASLAAGIGTLAIGNDGGGSIRIPASFSGLVGIKPTSGRVPHRQGGLFAMLASNGPIARSVADAVTGLRTIAEPDGQDWYALPPPDAGWLDDLTPDLSRLRLAYSPGFAGVAPDPDVALVVDAAVARLRQAGLAIDEVGPLIDSLQEDFQPYWTASIAFRMRQVPPERWGEVDPGFVALAIEGMDVSADELMRAEVARAALGRKLAAFHQSYDVLITAAMPHVAFPVETIYNTRQCDRWRDGVPYTLPFNLTGQPAMTLPCGLADGLPVGLQLVTAKYRERTLLQTALGIEQIMAFPQPHERLLQQLGSLLSRESDNSC